jgi:AcrR family transcriptional regulator
MTGENKPRKRTYDASGRRAAAAQRRLAVITAAREQFEERGWAGTRVEDLSRAAGVSQKTVEALFGTKSALLRAAVDYAIRGDVESVPMPRRDAIAEMEGAPDAPTMLRLHARHLRNVNVRSARIASVVEHAAAADSAVSMLWRTMNRNRAYGVDWATRTLLGKRGRRRGLTPEATRGVFWVALDWGTYRTLTELAGLDAGGYEKWLRDYYRALLLPATAPRP